MKKPATRKAAAPTKAVKPAAKRAKPPAPKQHCTECYFVTKDDPMALRSAKEKYGKIVALYYAMMWLALRNAGLHAEAAELERDDSFGWDMKLTIPMAYADYSRTRDITTKRAMTRFQVEMGQ